MLFVIIAIIVTMLFVAAQAYASVILNTLKIIGIIFAVIACVVSFIVLVKLAIPVLIVVGVILLVRWKQKKDEKEK